MIKPINHWSLNRVNPTIDDTESMSVLELVGKVTTKINELIKTYTEFETNITNNFNELSNTTKQEQECFKNQIIKLIHDYIAMIDEKIKQQDKEIEESITYIKNNISESVEAVVNEMKESGELDSALLNSFNDLNTFVEALTSRVESLEGAKPYMVYDELNKSLTFINMEEGVINE